MRYFLTLFLILAPLIDYTYKLRFPLTGNLVSSPNRIFKGLPILIALIIILYRTKRSFLWKYGVLLIYFTFLSMILGLFAFPGQALDTYIRFLSSIVYIFIAGKILTEEDMIFVFKCLVILTLIPVTISYLQHFHLIPYTDFDYIAGVQLGRVSGGYEKQVSMVSYIMYSFTVVLFYFFHTRKLHQKAFCILYIALVFGVVGLSTHRASIVVFTVIAFYFVFTYARKYIILFPLAILAIVIKYIKFMKEFFVLSVGFGRGDWGHILRGKFGFWHDYLHNLFSSGYLSILFGKGHPVLDSRRAGYLPYLFNEPHSDFVRILYQYGLLGFSLFLVIFSIIIKSSIVFRRNSTTLNEKLLGDMGIIIGIALMLYGITIEPTRYPVFWWYYSVIASYILVRGSYLNESGVYNKSLHPLQV